MKRRIAIIAVLVILGAIINVSVAWACVLWSPLDALEGRTQYSGEALPTVAPYVPDEWFELPFSTAQLRWMHQEHASFGQATERLGVSWMAPGISRLGSADSFVHIQRAGWPLLSFECVGRLEMGLYSPPEDWRGAITAPSRWTGYYPAELVFPEYRRRLPAMPLWPGFIINTLFYALPLWLIFLAPFAARRMIRRRRGQCETCAYPIGASPVCTECGAAIERTRRADA